MIAMMIPPGPRSRSILFLILPLLFPLSGLAKEKPDIRFDHYTIRDGLSQSTVNCIMQDRKGLIWIGTQDGLNRFNGYEFTIFQKDPGDSNSISNNFIHCLAEGPDGQVLIGTENGLDRFIRRERSFEGIPFENGVHPTVHDLERDEHGNLWIATLGHGLFVLRKDTGIALSPGLSNKGSLSVPSSIRSLRWEGNDSLWIGTSENGLFLYRPRREALLPTPINDTRIHALRPAAERSLWVGTERGLYLARSDGEGLKVRERVRAGSGKGQLPHPVVKAIHKDRQGRYWFGTGGGGLLRLYRKDGERRFFRYTQQDYISSSLANDIVNTIHEVRTGSIWIELAHPSA